MGLKSDINTERTPAAIHGKLLVEEKSKLSSSQGDLRIWTWNHPPGLCYSSVMMDDDGRVLEITWGGITQTRLSVSQQKAIGWMLAVKRWGSTNHASFCHQKKLPTPLLLKTIGRGVVSVLNLIHLLAGMFHLLHEQEWTIVYTGHDLIQSQWPTIWKL